MFIKAKKFLDFLQLTLNAKLEGIEEIILPFLSKFGTKDQTFLYNYQKDITPQLFSYRSIDPLKILFYLTRENMNRDEFAYKKRMIVGMKACDLKAMQIMDKALINNEFVDPSYYDWRMNTLIITTDCTEINKHCHCNLVGGNPYSESGYDLNLSQVNDMYYIKVGSENGERLLNTISNEFEVIEEDDKAEQVIEANRKKIGDMLKAQNDLYSRNGEVARLKRINFNEWIKESENCVGCGACTNICPSCYCLILNDETENKKFTKIRSYDSCQYNGYARVAGGGTPRPAIHQRFRNRYLCKFENMKNNFGSYGCTGCGRCIEACPANIDFRKAVKNLISEVIETQ